MSKTKGSLEEQRRVFLAYKAMFSGGNAEIRQSKAIETILSRNKQAGSSLAVHLGRAKVVSILKELLRQGVFASDQKAQLAFPALYQTSPAQDAAHEASEASTARSEAEALGEVAHENNGNSNGNGNGNYVNGVLRHEDADLGAAVQSPVSGLNGSLAETQVVADQAAGPPLVQASVPSLYPSQFPFSLQHEILCTVQKLLEHICYDFAWRNAPRVCREMAWDCPETIELSEWTKMFARLHGKLPRDAFSPDHSGRLRDTLLAVNDLRHAAVHRLRMSAKTISQMLAKAAAFAHALCDPARAALLKAARADLDAKIKSHELHKNYLERRLKDEIDEIERLRQELITREKEAVDAMLRDDMDNMHVVHSVLQVSLRRVFGTAGGGEAAGPSAEADPSAPPEGDEEDGDDGEEGEETCLSTEQQALDREEGDIADNERDDNEQDNDMWEEAIETLDL